MGQSIIRRRVLHHYRLTLDPDFSTVPVRIEEEIKLANPVRRTVDLQQNYNTFSS